MYKVRIVLSKLEPACYLSHLDFLKVLQRSFVRACLPVKYSQGFNPHIEMSIPVPLSTGYRSVCDLCDLELVTDEAPADLLERLNPALPRGITARAFGPAARPAREVSCCAYELEMPAGDERAMAAVFEGPVLLDKRSKRGSREVDLRDYIKEIAFVRAEERTVCRCVLAAGEDPLNPLYLARALRERGLLGELDGVRYTRTRILDEKLGDFLKNVNNNCTLNC